MAAKRDLLRLFRAIGAANISEARTLAGAIAEAERQQGHHTLAEQLRSSLNVQSPTGVQGSLFSQSDAAAPATLNALSALHGSIPLADVAMPAAIRRELVSVILEQRNVAALTEHGLRARRRILLHGPPGCGKSMTARALGAELGLPVFVVRLDAIVGAYLGQTASRVRELFRFLETVNSVVLIDEIDALGRSRGSERDIGELDRVAISLMQELEHSEPKGILVATSNVATALDKALLRRFDVVLEFRQPTLAELKRFAGVEAKKRGVRLSREQLARLSRGRSYASAIRIIQDAHREQLLRELTR